MLVCSSKRGITPKIRMLCFAITNSVLLNLFCVLALVILITVRSGSTHRGVNKRSKYVTQVKQQRPEDVPLVEFMYLVAYLHACQVRVTVGDSGLCCCTCVTSFER